MSDIIKPGDRVDHRALSYLKRGKVLEVDQEGGWAAVKWQRIPNVYYHVLDLLEKVEG